MIMHRLLYFHIVGADPVCINSTISYGYADHQPCALLHVSKVYCTLYIHNFLYKHCYFSKTHTEKI